MTRFGGIPELPDKAGMWIVLGRELWGLACLCRRMGLGLVPGLSKSFGGSKVIRGVHPAPLGFLSSMGCGL